MSREEPQLLVKPESPCNLLNGLTRNDALQRLAAGLDLPGVRISEFHFHPTKFHLCDCALCDPQRVAGIERTDVCLSCGHELDRQKPQQDFCETCLFDAREFGLCGNCLYVLDGDGTCQRTSYAFDNNV